MTIGAKEREQLIREQQASGQRVAQFCRERGLNAKCFYDWRRVASPAAPGAKGAEEGAKFVRVGNVTEITIELASQRYGVLRVKVPVELLSTVIKALGAER